MALSGRLTPLVIERVGNLAKVAQRLSIRTAGRAILVEGPEDTPVFMDYCFFEWPGAGRTLIQEFDPATLQLDAGETELLRALQAARASLFEVTGVKTSEHRILLRDVLEPQQPQVVLTDVALAQSVARVGTGLLFFLRVVTVAPYQITSGMVLVFPAARKPGLLESFRQRMKKVTPEAWSEERYAFFAEKSRSWGARTQQDDVSKVGLT